jgi:L-amino acid N-acyltransferase
MPPIIREAVETDLPGILAIYNEVIATSTAVYAEEPVTLAERRHWLGSKKQLGFPVLVTADAAGIAGFASFGDFRAWPCYRHSAEHSVHIRADRRGQGLGTALIIALLARAAALGKHVMIAGIDAENAASIALHEKLGFGRVAHFHEVGRKFDRWLDLVFLQRLLDQTSAEA